MTSSSIQPWLIISVEVILHKKYSYGMLPSLLLLSFLKNISVILPIVIMDFCCFTAELCKECSNISSEYWSLLFNNDYTLYIYSLFYVKLNFQPHLKQNDCSTYCFPSQERMNCYILVLYESLFTARHSRWFPCAWEHTATICCKRVTTSVSSYWCRGDVKDALCNF